LGDGEVLALNRLGGGHRIDARSLIRTRQRACGESVRMIIQRETRVVEPRGRFPPVSSRATKPR
jgi:hypothetical protein